MGLVDRGIAKFILLQPGEGNRALSYYNRRQGYKGNLFFTNTAIQQTDRLPDNTAGK